ncbi:MAG: sensor histidine kinase [Synergistaceae bacterium]|nr:sensor histidine kinase [Synergistaceae bacterium]
MSVIFGKRRDDIHVPISLAVLWNDDSVMYNVRMGLRSKFIALYVVFSVIPSLALGIFSYRVSYDALWKNTTRSIEQLASQLNMSIDSIVEGTLRFIDIGNSDYVRDYILGNDDYRSAVNVLRHIKVYRGNFPLSENIEDILIIGQNGKSIDEHRGVGTYVEGAADPALVARLFAKADTTDILVRRERDLYSGGGRVTLYVGRSFKVPPLREPYCAVVLKIDGTFIDRFCEQNDIAGAGHFTVFSRDGRVIFGPDYENEDERLEIFARASRSTSGAFTGTVSGKRSFVVFASSAVTGWKLVGQVPVAALMKEAAEIGRTTFVAVLLILVFAVALYAFFSNKLINPLRRLKAVMRIASLGDTGVRFNGGGARDEIRDVGESFNRMMDDLAALAKQDMEKQESLRNAELMLLQSQVNPHFLYNALDAILWQAKAGRTDAVASMTEALSTFFRISLSGGREWVSVREELSLVENYLLIQKTRYEDMLEYSVEADDSIFGHGILKLTVQPIVENAIYHGVKNKRGGGKLWVRGRESGENIIIEVSDDGAGMPPEKYAEINEYLHDGVDCVRNGLGGFGLKNVQSRIRLNYGPKNGVTLRPREGGGTTVEIVLRKIEDR